MNQISYSLKKQLLIQILFSLLLVNANSQEQGYICSEDAIYRVDMSTCASQLVISLGSSFSFTDIAVTPSGILYIINFEKLFRIDTSNNISLVATISSSWTAFNSLVALDDNWLLAVRLGSGLYKINTHTGETIHLGDLGYKPLGDLTFFKGHYYMIAMGNKLVRFDYNKSTNQISSVELVGTVNTNQSQNKFIYGLTTIGSATCDSDSLKMIAFEANDAFLVNPDNGDCSPICSSMVFGVITGAASLSEVQHQVYEENISVSIPNIFTPNKDGMNDFFEPQEIMWEISDCSISVFNRWGNLVFEDETKEYFRWDGMTKNGNECAEGVYYYKINLKGYCNNETELTGFVQLVR